jgi:hypothetical protein
MVRLALATLPSRISVYVGLPHSADLGATPEEPLPTNHYIRATMSLSPSPPNTYIIVARSASGAYFAPGTPLVFDGVPTEHGPVRIQFLTRRAHLPGFTKPVPRGLYAEIRGSAPSLDTAINTFVQAANAFCPLIALTCNAPIEDLQPDIAYDATRGSERRPFFQQFLLDERIMPIRRRRVPVEAAAALAMAMAKHSSSDRLHRASVHYYQALQNWRPGYETPALAHLYMSVETLTPLLRDEYLTSNQLSRDDLVQRWGIELRELDSQVRQRLIFSNDESTFKQARAASDGFEHGYMPFPDVRAKAIAVNRLTATYVRRAILDHLGLPSEQVKALLEPPFDEPFYLHYTKQIWGTLDGAGEDLAAPDQDYPMLHWRSSIRELPTLADQDPRIQFVETYDPRLAPGIRFAANRIEVFGPATAGTPESDEMIVPNLEHRQVGKPAFGLAGLEWNRPDLAPFATMMTRFLLNFGAIDLFSRTWLAGLSGGEEAGDDLTFDARLDRLLERVRGTKEMEPLRSRIEEAWLPTRRLAAMQDSVARSPLLFGWRGPEGERPPDHVIMLRRNHPHWPDSPEAVIVLAELSQAVEEASAIATRITTLAGEVQELLSATAPTTAETKPQEKL